MYPYRMQKAHVPGAGFYVKAAIHVLYYGVVDGVIESGGLGMFEIHLLGHRSRKQGFSQYAEGVTYLTFCHGDLKTLTMIARS